MRATSFFALATLALSSFLGGCVGDATDFDSIDDESALDEEIGEAEEAIVGCFGEACNGQDPGLMGCETDAVTVASSSVYSGSLVTVGTIAIRRSQACNAVWARTSTASGTAYIRSEISRVSPASSSQGVSSSPVSALRSPMIGAKVGSTYKAKGFTGVSPGVYPNTGNVSKTL